MDECLKKIQNLPFEEITKIIAESLSTVERGYAALQLDYLFNNDFQNCFDNRNLLIDCIARNLENYSICNIIITSFNEIIYYQWAEIHDFVASLLSEHDKVNIRIASLIVANAIPYFDSEDFEIWHATIMLVLYNCATSHLSYELADILARITYCSDRITDFIGPINECFISLEHAIALGDEYVTNSLSVPLCAIIESGKVPEILPRALEICTSASTNLSLFWILNSLINTYPDEISQNLEKIFSKTLTAMKICPTQDVLYIAETMELLTLKFSQQFITLFRQNYDIKTERSIFAFVVCVSSTAEHLPTLINQNLCHLLILSLQCTQMYVKLATLEAMKEVALVNEAVRVTFLEQLYDLMGVVDIKLLEKAINVASFIIDSFTLPSNMVQTLVDRIRVLIRPSYLCRHLCVSLVFSVGISVARYNHVLFPIICRSVLETPTNVDKSLKCRSIEALAILSYGRTDTKAEDAIASCMHDETDEVVISILSAVSYFAKFEKNILVFKNFTEKYVKKFTETFTQEFFECHSLENFFIHSKEEDEEIECIASEDVIQETTEKFERSQHGWFLTVSILAKRLFKHKCSYDSSVFIPVCKRILKEGSSEEKKCALKALSYIFISAPDTYDEKVVQQIASVSDKISCLTSLARIIAKFSFCQKDYLVKLIDFCLEYLLHPPNGDVRKNLTHIYSYLSSLLVNYESIFPLSHIMEITSFPNVSQSFVVKIIIEYLRHKKDEKIINYLTESLQDFDLDAAGEVLYGFAMLDIEKVRIQNLPRFLNFGGVAANGALSYLTRLSYHGVVIRDILEEIIDAFDCVRFDANFIIIRVSEIILQDDHYRAKCAVRIVTSLAAVLTLPDDVWDQMNVCDEARLKLVNALKAVVENSHEANINLVAFLSINNRMERFNRRSGF